MTRKSAAISIAFILFTHANIGEAKHFYNQQNDINTTRITWVAKNKSEVKVINKSSNKIELWRLTESDLTIQLIPNNDKNLVGFKVSKFQNQKYLIIKGYIQNSVVKISTLESKISTKYFNTACIKTKENMIDWMKDVQAKFENTNDIDSEIIFDKSCTTSQQKAFDEFITQNDKILKVVGKCFDDIKLLREAHGNIVTGNTKISCKEINSDKYSAFYQSGKPEIINLDPSLFLEKNKLIKNYFHELLHAAEIVDEERAQETTSSFMQDIDSQKNTKCTEDPGARSTWAIYSADNLVEEDKKNKEAIPVATNPQAARAVQLQMDSPQNFTPPTTPQEQAKFIADSAPARNSAIFWANDVVRAVSKAAIPVAQAETLADSSTGSARRYSGTNNGSTATAMTTSTFNKVESATAPRPVIANSKVAAKQELQNPTTSPSSTNSKNELGSGKGSVASTSLNPTTRQTSVNTQSRSPSSTSSSGGSSGGDSSSANLKTSTNVARQAENTSGEITTLIDYIQKNRYEIVKSRLLDEDFQQELKTAGIKIITLDGVVFGAQNGKTIFSDRKIKFVKESR